MSWMTKEGSSSALAQPQPRFQLNEPASLETDRPEDPAETVARRECVVGGRCAQPSGTESAKKSWIAGTAAGESVYPSEGFG